MLTGRPSSLLRKSHQIVVTMDHSDLMREMQHVEKLPTRQRLLLARRRRAMQLEKWMEMEKNRIQQERLHPKQRKINKVTYDSAILFLDAASHDSIEEVYQMLARGIKPDMANVDGLTALHQACINNSANMVKLLLSHGAYINATDVENWTPLHAAAACSHLDIIKILIQHGADLLAPNDDGSMPYDICEDDNALDVIETAMAKQGITQGVIDDRRSEREKSLLKDIEESSREDVLEYRTVKGGTLHHVAACYGFVDVVRKLLQDFPELLNIPDEDGWLPIHAAAYWRNFDIIDVYVREGRVMFNVATDLGETVFNLCDDDEFRERLLLLKRNMEREFKRNSLDSKTLIGGVVKRSISNRGSVRRRSSQEKSKTPRKEALEEAKLRLQKEMQGHKKQPPPKDIVKRVSFPKINFGNGRRNSKHSVANDLDDDDYEVVPDRMEVEMPENAEESTIPHRGTLGELKFGGANFKAHLHAEMADNEEIVEDNEDEEDLENSGDEVKSSEENGNVSPNKNEQKNSSPPLRRYTESELNIDSEILDIRNGTGDNNKTKLKNINPRCCVIS